MALVQNHSIGEGVEISCKDRSGMDYHISLRVRNITKREDESKEAIVDLKYTFLDADKLRTVVESLSVESGGIIRITEGLEMRVTNKRKSALQVAYVGDRERYQISGVRLN